MATPQLNIRHCIEDTIEVCEVEKPLENDLDNLRISDAVVKPEVPTQPSGSVPALQQFCADVMVKVEAQLMKMIVDERGVVDREFGVENIHAWHFDMIEDSRNYLVYHIVDLVFGFAKHGEKLLQKTLCDVRFQDLVRFVVREENDCFFNACSQADYFSTLANCMMRLSTLAHFTNDNDEEIREADIPVDPVDVLLHLFKSEAGSFCNLSYPIDELLDRLKLRLRDAQQDNDNTSRPMLSRIQVHKETFKQLLKFEKRMEKLSSAVKLISQQMLQREDDGDAKVVTLFGHDIFFIAPLESRSLVNEFFRMQKSLSSVYSDGQDQADAQACLECPHFLPLIKEVTCMPKSLLEYIDKRCKQLEKRERKMDQNATEHAVLNGIELASREETPDTESAERSSEAGKESAEQKPESTEDKSKEALKNQTGKNVGELLNEELDEGIGESDYIFTVSSSATERISYLCPVLSYLPLLPVLRVLSGKITGGASVLDPSRPEPHTFHVPSPIPFTS